MAQEMGKREGLFAVGGLGEWLEAAEMPAEACDDEIGIAHPAIGWRGGRVGKAETCLGWLAFLGAEIPAPARGLVALHQTARAAAYLPVESLHLLAFALFCLGRELAR